MTVSMFARHKVDDFATWKKLYDEVIPQARKEGGILADSVHRDPDDPNMAIAYHQFTDVNAAKAHAARLNGDEMRSMAETVGIHMDTLEVWLGEDI